MSLRTKLVKVIEVLLRVPPLFVIDEILRFGLGLSQFTDSLIELDARLDGNVYNSSYTEVDYDSKFYGFVAISVARFLLSTLGCLVTLCLFVLTLENLTVVYMYLMSYGVVLVSYWTNFSTMQIVTASSNAVKGTSVLEDFLFLNFEKLLDPSSPTMAILQNYVLQFMLAIIFTNIYLGCRHHIWKKLLPISFILPSILATLPLPPIVLTRAPLFCALVPILLVKLTLWSSILPVIHTIYDSYLDTRTFINNFGMSALIEAEWVRLSVPEVLRTFWMLKFMENMAIFFLNGNWNTQEDPTPISSLIKNLMVSGCDTLTTVLGITSVVSFVCNQIGVFFQWLMLTDDENDKSIGTVSAILFYILALQTGLSGLEPEKRFVRLCRNFCLLFTALLHFIHNIVNPLLMSLSASHNPSLRRHLRALLVCGFLILFPILLLTYLWSNHNISTWLLAVTAFSIEVIVKVFVSLAIYGLFLLDAKRDTFWERLDDYVYYIRSFGNTVEFCFGIFLFFNGAWILVFESGGAIRAVMMCIHAYFNIWCDARAGWSVFMKRRTAVHKIESLPEAGEEQLRLLDDVCAICYQEMKTAKITRCKHFFHGVCLRKWLYVQDRCPLCHEVLHSIEFEDLKENANQDNVPPMMNNDVNEINNYNR